MTKELLEQYPDICDEIKRLGLPVTDTVLESSKGFPYNIHPVKIGGVGIDRAARRKKLREQKAEIEAFASSLEDSRDRLIVEAVMEFGRPIPWGRIAARLGHRWTIDKARYAYSKFCKKYFM